jgi:hypothetical protein
LFKEPVNQLLRALDTVILHVKYRVTSVNNLPRSLQDSKLRPLGIDLDQRHRLILDQRIELVAGNFLLPILDQT